MIVLGPFIDTSMMTANLLLRYRSAWGGAETFDITDLMLQEWKTAAAFLRRLRGALTTDKTPTLERPRILRIDPGSFVPWAKGEEPVTRAVVCLVPSPGLKLYSGGSEAVPAVGQVLLHQVDELHTGANFGNNAAILFVCDLSWPAA